MHNQQRQQGANTKPRWLWLYNIAQGSLVITNSYGPLVGDIIQTEVTNGSEDRTVPYSIILEK